MTLEEKIAHLQETVMTEARSEGNAIIDNHKKALESLFEKHIFSQLSRNGNLLRIPED